MILEMGDSRNYPYHTVGAILEFRGRGGGFLDWKSEGVGGGNALWNSKGMGGGGFSSEFSEFPEGRQ